ncbi:MAG: hypothetical protein H6637_05355 [Ardenticatenales bacterium]|nr:hypothetical protein [Ardenticatenales bacterium]
MSHNVPRFRFNALLYRGDDATIPVVADLSGYEALMKYIGQEELLARLIEEAAAEGDE